MAKTTSEIGKDSKALTPKVQRIVLQTNAKGIQANITTIETTGKVRETLIHVTACSVLAHVQKHGDITLATRLVNALARTERKNALLDWFCAFGKMSYNSEAKALAYDGAKQTEQVKAELMPFWEFKPEAEYKPIKETDGIAALIVKLEARQAAITKMRSKDVNYSTADVIHAETIAALKAVLDAAKLAEEPVTAPVDALAA